MKPEDLLKTAHILALAPLVGRPRQSDLKRALSTAYYALFHALCLNCADRYVGGMLRNSRAWNQVYRSVSHGQTKEQFSNRQVISEFPDSIQGVASAFIKLQKKRNKADYDPALRLTRASVATDIALARQAVEQLKNTELKDKKAFAVLTLLRKRTQ